MASAAIDDRLLDNMGIPHIVKLRCNDKRLVVFHLREYLRADKYGKFFSEKRNTSQRLSGYQSELLCGDHTTKSWKRSMRLDCKIDFPLGTFIENLRDNLQKGRLIDVVSDSLKEAAIPESPPSHEVGESSRKRKREFFECDICADDEVDVEDAFVPIACRDGHRMCKRCAESIVNGGVKENAPMECLCGAEFTTSDLENAGISEEDMKNISTRAVERAVFESTDGDEMIVFCDKCFCMFSAPANFVDILRCPSPPWGCGKPVTRSDDDDDKVIEYLRRQDGQRCPTCKQGCIKKNGCNHMVCVTCKSDFCYTCGSAVKSPLYHCENCHPISE